MFAEPERKPDRFRALVQVPRGPIEPGFALTLDLPSFLQRYVCHQLAALFPTFDDAGGIDLGFVRDALDRTNLCVSRIISPRGPRFDPLVSGQYATFLYHLSRQVWLDGGPVREATRLFLLNKALNGIDLFYEIEMPNVFAIGHTVGMVFAKARYGERAVFHQGCTVGRSGEARPILGDGLVMYPNSSIIGRCRVGENSVLAPGVQVVNTDIPGNCLVFQGLGRELVFKPIDEPYADRYVARS